LYGEVNRREGIGIRGCRPVQKVGVIRDRDPGKI